MIAHGDALEWSPCDSADESLFQTSKTHTHLRFHVERLLARFPIGLNDPFGSCRSRRFREYSTRVTERDERRVPWNVGDQGVKLCLGIPTIGRTAVSEAVVACRKEGIGERGRGEQSSHGRIFLEWNRCCSPSVSIPVGSVDEDDEERPASFEISGKEKNVREMVAGELRSGEAGRPARTRFRGVLLFTDSRWAVRGLSRASGRDVELCMVRQGRSPSR